MIFPILLAIAIIVIAVLSVIEFRHFQQVRKELQQISDIAILTAQASMANDKDVLDDLARAVLVDMKFESPIQMESQSGEDRYSITLSANHNSKILDVFGNVPDHFEVTSEVPWPRLNWSWKGGVRSLYDFAARP